MFDPTAYENIKVILEGAVYDLDLEGQVSVIDRNDTFNLSKLTRHFDMTFSLHVEKPSPKARITLTTEDLYKEINLDEEDVGCHIQVEFILTQNASAIYPKLREQLFAVWGNRPFDFQKHSSMLKDSEELSIVVSFPRTIKEDQVDDLVEWIAHCFKTLQVLENI